MTNDPQKPMNEMTHLTAEERGTLDRARETPFARGIFDHSRTGYGCNCGWASKVHGDTCPEHGNPARRTMEIDASTVEKLLADLNAARAKLAALAIEHEHAMQALMLGDDEAKKELLAARAKLAKLEGVAQMAMRPERDAYDQYHDWHGRLRGAAVAALAAKDAAEGRVG